MIPVDAEYCEECGAHLSEDPSSRGSDIAVYDELAQSNLLRIRGQYREAADLCLRILHRFPNNATAHTLLGDIYAEMGDLPQAEQWYEMALDLKPNSESDRQKLEGVISRMEDKQAVDTAARLGLPATHNRAMLFSTIVVVLVLIVGASAFILGGMMKSPPPAEEVVDTPVVVSQPEPDQGVPARPDAAMRLDGEVLRSLQDGSPYAGAIVGAAVDPRGPSLILTIATTGNEDPQILAGRIAHHVLSVDPRFVSVTLRVIRNGSPVFVADAQPDTFRAVQNRWPGYVAQNLPEEAARGMLLHTWQAIASTP